MPQTYSLRISCAPRHATKLTEQLCKPRSRSNSVAERSSEHQCGSQVLRRQCMSDCRLRRFFGSGVSRYTSAPSCTSLWRVPLQKHASAWSEMVLSRQALPPEPTVHSSLPRASVLDPSRGPSQWSARPTMRECQMCSLRRGLARFPWLLCNLILTELSSNGLGYLPSIRCPV
jgi:hypothetical protein